MAGVSSGRIEANTAISIERAKVLSVHVHSNANCTSNILMIKVWDSRPEDGDGNLDVASGTQSKSKEIFRCSTSLNHSSNTVGSFNYESDLHGVVCNKGIYVEFIDVDGGGANSAGTGQVFVNYA